MEFHFDLQLASIKNDLRSNLTLNKSSCSNEMMAECSLDTTATILASAYCKSLVSLGILSLYQKFQEMSVGNVHRFPFVTSSFIPRLPSLSPAFRAKIQKAVRVLISL